jgi:PhnB protein
MKSIDAYLFFENQCREAMTFYQSCFGGELFLQTVGESPVAGNLPVHMHHFIMHASLKTGDITLMASDNCMGTPIVKGSTVSLSISCNTVDELHNLFAKLAEGGSIFNEPKLEFWGDTFASLTDKYGFSWMLLHNDR